MEEQDIYTITIVHNIGTPISFTVKKWKIYLSLILFTCSFLLILFGSIQYIKLHKENGELNQSLTKVQKTSELLEKQIAKSDNEHLWQNQKVSSPQKSAIQKALLDQPEFSTEGIWVTQKSNIETTDFSDERNLVISKINTSVKGDDLVMWLRIKNLSNVKEDVGGYICVTLVNNDLSPATYKTATGGAIGEEGFPSTYKSGKEYYIRKNRSYRRYKLKSIPLVEMNEYYTDAIFFIYSYKGRLLNKQIIPLDKKIFLE